jgi:hypothetical protein
MALCPTHEPQVQTIKHLCAFCGKLLVGFVFKKPTFFLTQRKLLKNFTKNTIQEMRKWLRENGFSFIK